MTTAYYLPLVQQQFITPMGATVPLPHPPFNSPYNSPRVSPAAVLVPLLTAPAGPLAVSRPRTTLSNPLPSPPAHVSVLLEAPIALATSFLCHSLLALDPYDPKILWDARRPPETIRTNDSPSHSLHQTGSLDEHATTPAWTFIRLRCNLLPWSVEFENPKGITVGDVLNVLYDFLRQPTSSSEWRDKPDEFRLRLIDAWRRRCLMEEKMNGRKFRLKEEKAGIRRVDWLLWDYEFLGLEYIGQVEPETWVVHFRSR